MLQHRTSVHSFCPTSTNDRSRWHMRCNLTYEYGGPTIQILIAEDDPNVRSLVQNVVTDLGHAPSCAAVSDRARVRRIRTSSCSPRWTIPSTAWPACRPALTTTWPSHSTCRTLKPG